MKRVILLTLILSFLLIAAGGPTEKGLVRFTVINKSGEELFIHLQNTTDCFWECIIYNFTIPVGTKTEPYVKEFTISRDIYNMTVSYVREWDPVYTYSPCADTTTPTRLMALRNIRINFSQCTQFPPIRGERSMDKYWQGFILNPRAFFTLLRQQRQRIPAQPADLSFISACGMKYLVHREMKP